MNLKCLMFGHIWNLESDFMVLNKGLYRCERCRILREINKNKVGGKGK